MKSSRILHLPATVSDGALGQRDYQQFSWRRNWTMHRYDQDWIEERKVTMKRDLGEMFVSSAIEFHPMYLSRDRNNRIIIKRKRMESSPNSP